MLTWLASGKSAADDDGSRHESLASAGVVERWLTLPYPILRPSAWLKIYRETANHDVVVVHDAIYMTSIFGYFAARARRKPFVVVQHVAFIPFRNVVLRALMHIANRCVAMPLLKRAHQVIFISAVTEKYFSRVHWRRAPTLVFNGVDTRVFSPVVDALQLGSERRGLGLPMQPQGGPVCREIRGEKGPPVALEYVARERSDLLFAFAGHGPIDPTSWRLPNVRVFAAYPGPDSRRSIDRAMSWCCRAPGRAFPWSSKRRSLAVYQSSAAMIRPTQTIERPRF